MYRSCPAKAALCRRFIVCAFALMSLTSAGCGEESKALGEVCERDAQCATGTCAVHDGVGHCSQPCDATTACPAGADGVAMACREDGFCGPECAFSGVRNGFFCDGESGAAALCETASDVEVCDVCTCTPFGGGVCVPSLGCIDPLANGAACTVDFACQSGLCNPDTDRCTAPLANGTLCPGDRYCGSNLCDPVTDRCVAPLANGTSCSADKYCMSGHCDATLGCFTPGPVDAPCTRDAHCASNNCSNDGFPNVQGQCNIPLGGNCQYMPGVCNQCLSGSFGAFCSRDECNANAPCPTNWDCRDTTDGNTGCFQRCNPNENVYSQCWGSRYCRYDGICVSF